MRVVLVVSLQRAPARTRLRIGFAVTQMKLPRRSPPRLAGFFVSSWTPTMSHTLKGVLGLSASWLRVVSRIPTVDTFLVLVCQLPQNPLMTSSESRQFQRSRLSFSVLLGQWRVILQPQLQRLVLFWRPFAGFISRRSASLFPVIYLRSLSGTQLRITLDLRPLLKRIRISRRFCPGFFPLLMALLASALTMVALTARNVALIVFCPAMHASQFTQPIRLCFSV